MKEKAACVAVYPWLKSNLGKRCLAPVTSTDAKALEAAVQVIRLYGHCDQKDEAGVLQAFRSCVLCMQPHTRELAYHAIAMQTEWVYRERIWNRAGLPTFDHVRVCAFEPGGSGKEFVAS